MLSQPMMHGPPSGNGTAPHLSISPTSEPIINPPQPHKWNTDELKPLLWRNVQVLGNGSNPWKMGWIMGKIIAVDAATVSIRKHWGEDVSVPISGVGAIIRLADF